MIKLKGPQWTVFCSEQRFRVLVAGRRFGKTFLALVELCQAAWSPGKLVWYVAPTYKQAKRIAWKPLKQMTRPYWASIPNETDLRIELVSGGTICLRGADNYDSLRGDGLDFLILDEYASIAREAWTEVLRPALADKLGRALFIGTPHGFNHFYELVESAETHPDWKAFHFTSAEGGNIPPGELESASKEMDRRTYEQEFEAKFANLGVGRVYYAFERVNNVRNLKFNARFPLAWALDFNIYSCAVLVQVVNGVVGVLEEMIIPDSSTPAACEEFLRRTEKWNLGFPMHLDVYGDASGNQRRSSAPSTDWQLIREFFARYPDRFRVTYHVHLKNPQVKDRVNCVNARLENYAGQHRLFVDRNCRHLIRDLEQVSWKADPYGNLLADLNKSDPTRTHVSDALGYLIAHEFPLQVKMGEKPGPSLL